MKRTIVAALTLALTLGVTPPGLGTVSPDAAAVIAKMLDRNANLKSFQARVHVDMRMLNFPFLSPKLDGTAYFKRPNKSEVVFDSVPAYAKGFESLFDDVADPTSWQIDSNIVSHGRDKLDG